MTEFISKTDGSVFYQGLALLAQIADKDQEDHLDSIADDLTDQGTISPFDFLRADSNGNDQIDAADNFALGDPVLLREVNDYVSTYFPEFATDRLQLVPDNFGETADDLATLGDMEKEVSSKVEKDVAKKEAELLASIPLEGTVEELFGPADSREGSKKRATIIGIPLLDRSGDRLSETAKVVVTLKDHSTRTVVFHEYRTGTAKTVFGETIEQAYGRFYLEVVETYSFSDRSFFEAYQKMSRANDEENNRDLTVGTVAGGVMTTGLIIHSILKTSVQEKMILELIANIRGGPNYWPIPYGTELDFDYRFKSLKVINAPGVSTETTLLGELEQKRGIKLYYRGADYETIAGKKWISDHGFTIKITNSSLALTTGQRILSGLGRLAFWAGLATLVWEVGSSAYSTLFPTPEEKLRQDIGQLFRPEMTFGQFEGTIIDKPDLRKDLQIMAWQMHQQGLM